MPQVPKTACSGVFPGLFAHCRFWRAFCVSPLFLPLFSWIRVRSDAVGAENLFENQNFFFRMGEVRYTRDRLRRHFMFPPAGSEQTCIEIAQFGIHIFLTHSALCVFLGSSIHVFFELFLGIECLYQSRDTEIFSTRASLRGMCPSQNAKNTWRLTKDYLHLWAKLTNC